MDIHRCRFVPYPPSAINAVAFSHGSYSSQQKTPQDLRLALGRANGDIEIWNPAKGNWFQETILRGGRDRSIEGLAWTEEPDDDDTGNGGKLRLFSIGFSSSITEWDLERGTTLRHANGNYGEIWCFAAQPKFKRKEKDTNSTVQDAQPTSQYLAAGCADGNILLFTTEDGDLKFSKVLGAPPTKKPRVLSIAWKNRNVVVAGYSDGTIRLYDIRARKFLRSMTLGKPTDGSSETLVWSVKCLPDETIVSGDSTGEIKIWDAQNYSLVQRLQAHRADVLAIAASADGETILSGGADRRTVAFKLLGSKKSGKSRRWAEIMHRRFHRHDVKALATFESTDLSVLASGGLDTIPIIAPLREWQSEYHRSLPNLPRIPQTCSAPAARLLVSWWDREVSIWHMQHSTVNGVHQDQTPGRYQLVTKILLVGDENITSAHITKDGRALAVSTAVNIKLFSLRKKIIQDKVVLRVRTAGLPQSVQDSGARIVKFSPDGSWLGVVRPRGDIYLVKIRIPSDSSEAPEAFPRVIHLRRRSRRTGSSRVSASSQLGRYEHTVISAAFSSNSRIFSVGDISGSIDSWILYGDEAYTNSTLTNDHLSDSGSDDSSDESSDEENSGVLIHGQQWTHSPSFLPNLGSPILLLSFKPSQSGSTSPTSGDVSVPPKSPSQSRSSHDDSLVAVTAQHHIAEFEVMQGKLSDWSRRNPSSYLPESFTVIKDRVMDCFWDVSNGYERMYLYGPTWIYMIDLSKDLPDQRIVGKLGHHEVVKPADSILGKRKWSPEAATKLHNSGAGDAMHVSKSYVGVGKKMIKFKGDDEVEAVVQSIDLSNKSELQSDDEDDEALRSSLANLRRTQLTDNGSEETPQLEKAANGDLDSIDPVSAEVVKAEQRRGCWHTFNYRSILGIMPLSDQAGVAHSNPEVVLVERPLWDIDLPPRYDED